VRWYCCDCHTGYRPYRCDFSVLINFTLESKRSYIGLWCFYNSCDISGLGLSLFFRPRPRPRASLASLTSLLLTRESWSWSRVWRPTRHSLGHFGGGLPSQSLNWYWQTKHCRKIVTQSHKLNTSQKANDAKYSKTKLPWFSHLLRHRVMNGVSGCPDVKNYKWRLNPIWHRLLYSCTHVATVDVKGLIKLYMPTHDKNVAIALGH